ncbi:MAG: DUF3108 domain-containing protein [Bacteroidetes bacterium]|nr:DUF3108 domain-containing protein [Bacteroidota bacterium]
MMRMLLKRLWISIGLFLVVFVAPLSAQSEFTFNRDEPPTMEMMIDSREVFRYEVTYGWFTLGWIDVQLLPDSTFNGQKAYHLQTVMEANSSNILIGKNLVHYENLFQFNEKWPYSFVFWRDDLHDNEPNRTRIIFDRDSSKVHFYERGELEESLDLEEPASGGDIIFYYSRMFAGEETPYKLPVYIENELGYVTSSSSKKTYTREYEAFNEPIETYLSEGHADINGPFGFRGNFKSWFSTGDLRVPVEAHVKVIFGNVKVRLISYSREGGNY